MAMTCSNLIKECNGCMHCVVEPIIVGECAFCGDLLYDNEIRYCIDDELLHDECLRDWADKFKVKT